jgi:hypothetical protein
MYRQVDILNGAGLAASIVHQKSGFRADWFQNKTPIVHPPVPTKQHDILVLPEIFGSAIAETNEPVRKVIFNQNAYYTFRGHTLDTSDFRTPYHYGDVISAIVVSEDSRRYLSHCFPRLPLHRIRYSVDPTLFYYPKAKQKQIAFMPRKSLEDAQQIINILKFRRALKDFGVVPIDKNSEKETAAILRDSALFLSFGHPEGFGLPPAEAMACGCVTIGYHGNGGREFWKPEFSFPIEVGDILGYAKTVQRVIELLSNDPAPFMAMTRHASEFIRQTYSPESERKDILSVWMRILEANPAKT